VAILCLVCLEQWSNATLAQRLRVLRIAAGLSQSQFARRARIGEPTLRLAEAGKTTPRAATVARLAHALRTTVGVLTGEERLSTTTDRNGKPRGRR
jgi:transcriptional regulator with XRE-family HTH domain